jgi:hypothetical protein
MDDAVMVSLIVVRSALGDPPGVPGTAGDADRQRDT